MADRFSTSLPYFSGEAFHRRAHYLFGAYNADKMGSWVNQLGELASVLAAAVRADVLLLDSIWKADLLACSLIGLWPRSWRPIIVMHGEMWNPDSGIAGAIEKAIVSLADRAITRYIVISSEELTAFPKTWRVDPAKMRCCPFFFTLKEHEISQSPSAEGIVFSGGNSHRDYEPIVAAARQFPDRQFVIATQLLDGRDDLPANLTAGSTSHEQFVAHLHAAEAIIVPITRGLNRSAGQQTYLNAMLLGKPTIVTDGFGVRDHIADKETALIIEGSEASLSEALHWVFDPANELAVRQMCSKAQHVVGSRFRYEDHIEGILAVMDEVQIDAQ